MSALHMEAGDNAVQAHTDSGVINVGIVLTVTEIRQIALDVAKSVFLDSLPIAKDLINARTEHITDEVIRKLTAKDEKLYQRFQDPRFLGPLASIQRSYAETGDRELGGVLSGLLVDLAAEPIRSRREIVLREAIECAPKLTTKHLNALSAHFRITRMTHPLALDVPNLITLLEEEFRPYYGAVPTDEFDYSYMDSTQAGTFVRTVGRSVYAAVFHQHRNAMYSPFDKDELPELASGTIEGIQADFNEIVQLIEVPYELSKDDPVRKLKMRHAAAQKILTTDAATLTAYRLLKTKCARLSKPDLLMRLSSNRRCVNKRLTLLSSSTFSGRRRH